MKKLRHMAVMMTAVGALTMLSAAPASAHDGDHHWDGCHEDSDWDSCHKDDGHRRHDDDDDNGDHKRRRHHRHDHHDNDGFLGILIVL